MGKGKSSKSKKEVKSRKRTNSKRKQTSSSSGNKRPKKRISKEEDGLTTLKDSKTFLPCEAQIPFCPNCNTLILVRENGAGNCNNCHFQCVASELPGKEIVAASRPKIPQKWLSAEDKKTSDSDRKVSEHATVKEQCPVCNHDRASFFTMQLRSADEGQTVFYTCLKCEHKWRLNN
eukprot:g495.t1